MRTMRVIEDVEETAECLSLLVYRYSPALLTVKRFWGEVVKQRGKERFLSRRSGVERWCFSPDLLNDDRSWRERSCNEARPNETTTELNKMRLRPFSRSPPFLLLVPSFPASAFLLHKPYLRPPPLDVDSLKRLRARLEDDERRFHRPLRLHAGVTVGFTVDGVDLSVHQKEGMEV